MTGAENSPTVESDLACLHCGYNLRTSSFDGRCPECGAAVAESLSGLFDGPEVARAIRTIHRGLTVHFLLAVPIITYPFAALIGRWLIARGECELAATPHLSWRVELQNEIRRLARSGRRALVICLLAWIPIVCFALPDFGDDRLPLVPFPILLLGGAFAEVLAVANNVRLLGICGRIAGLDGSKPLASAFATDRTSMKVAGRLAAGSLLIAIVDAGFQAMGWDDTLCHTLVTILRPAVSVGFVAALGVGIVLFNQLVQTGRLRRRLQRLS